MSVRFDTTTDNLTSTFSSSLSIGVGDLTVGYWIRPTSTNNAWRSVQMLFNVGFTQLFGTYEQPSSNTINSNTNQGNGGTYNLTNATWYYIAVSRASGSTIRFRIFDDSTSTTPIFTDTTACTVNYTGIISSLFGNHALLDPAPLVEITSYKIYTGAEWSNAECRTESQTFNIQKSGGIESYAWGLETIDNVAYGLLGLNGEPSFVNTGVVNGSFRPTQLELPGSGPQYKSTIISPVGTHSPISIYKISGQSANSIVIF